MDYGTISLVILFLVPMLKSFLEKYIKSRPRRSARILRAGYWLVLVIPLIFGIVDNHNRVRAGERDAKLHEGIDLATEGRRHLDAGLDAKSLPRIELGIPPLKRAIEILGQFPSEYNREIQARHDLALTLERIAYGDSSHACTYQLEGDRITAKYDEGGARIANSPEVVAAFRCTDFDFENAEEWYRAEEQYDALYQQLLIRPEPSGEDSGSEFPAAARSTAYFFVCDNLRVGGSALDKARRAFAMVSDITGPGKGDLPRRHGEAKAKLRFLDALDNMTKVDNADWQSSCMRRGAAVAIPEKTRAAMIGSSWQKNLSCPDLQTLMLLRIPYWGFDGKAHQGEMIVAKSVSTDVLKVFGQLYAEGFPIERMSRLEEYGGDDNASMAANNTAAFNCRPGTGSSSLSEHSYGTAIDINPKQNPYVKGSTVLPPEGKDYLDRRRVRAGMVEQGPVREAFGSVGWKWGGDWESLKDYQHFSRSGR